MNTEFATAFNPLTKVFSLMGKGELMAFYKKFMLDMPYCLDEMIQSVWKTPGFENWNADFSPESLNDLGGWFAQEVRLRNSHVLEGVNVFETDTSVAKTERFDFTEDVRHLIVQVGMYYGQVAVKNNSSLGWMQLFGSKRAADYGQPVVDGPSKLPTNPVRVCDACAWGWADESNTGLRLRNSYNAWMELIDVAE